MEEEREGEKETRSRSNAHVGAVFRVASLLSYFVLKTRNSRELARCSSTSFRSKLANEARRVNSCRMNSLNEDLLVRPFRRVKDRQLLGAARGQRTLISINDILLALVTSAMNRRSHFAPERSAIIARFALGERGARARAAQWRSKSAAVTATARSSARERTRASLVAAFTRRDVRPR